MSAFRRRLARCARQDSNLRPLPPQGSALSPELRARGAASVAALVRRRSRATASSGTSMRTYASATRRRATALVTRPTAFSPSGSRRRGATVGLELQHAQAAVRVAAVVQPRDRLLARVAALREADRPLGQAGLGRQHAVVDLAAEARACRLGCGGARAPRRAIGAPRARVEQLDGRARRSRRSGAALARRGRSSTCAPRARSRPSPRSACAAARAHAVAELGLGEQQEVVGRRAAARAAARSRAPSASAAAPRSDSPGASASTSFETIRCRKSAASGPATRTNARGRRRDGLSSRLV